jgi:D-glycero-D-manno-heptose 1,7-bisphosphate phosphatase
MNKALFLDRDGIINNNLEGYTHKLENLEILDGIVEICLEAKRRDYKIIIVTNQGGIGLGYFTEEDFWVFMGGIYKHFLQFGIEFTKTYFAPYHPRGTIEKYIDKSLEKFRKPNAGMILQAQAEFNIDLSQSVLIGDNITDIQAGLNAGVGRNIWVQSGRFTSVF